jgi:hypothetical protein
VTAPTPPVPPTPDPVDSLVGIGHRIRDAADLEVKRLHLHYGVVIVVLVIVFALAGYKAWEWHVEKLARLEAAASVEHAAATSEAALADAWKTRALTKVDSFRVDTLRVGATIRGTKVDTLWRPAAPAPVEDGVTYSGPAPLVPIEVVAKADFDSLGATCTRTQHDCASALAAKDSVIAHDSSQSIALAALNANTAEQLKSVKRAALFQKLGWALAGLLIGRETSGIR